jgi:hypothetical protein
MARTVGRLPAPKDRRRIVHVKGKYKVEETHPSANTTTFTVVDKSEDEEGEHHHPKFLEVCWPTVFGIVLAIVAERLRLKVIREWGDVGDRIVFPFVQVASRPELGLGDAADGLSKLILRLQFPLTGLYATWNLMRGGRLTTTILQILFAYGICAFVLWLLTTPGASHGM